MAVEDELVLTADEAAEGEGRAVLAGSTTEHHLPLDALAGVVGRGREVEDQGRSGERLCAGRWAGLPDVLADGQTDPVRSEIDQAGAGAGREVALLVEDAVVWEVDLVVDAVEAAVGEDGGRVVDGVGPFGEADDGDDPHGERGQPLEGGGGVPEEVVLEEEVLGRVSGDRELWKGDELGSGVASVFDAGGDLSLVCGDVADRRVHLAEGEAECRRI